MGAGLLWGRSVLIVDDDDFTRSLVVMMLRKFQALKIHEARHGADALKQTSDKGGAIDIVLADLNMPVMNGLELLKAVRTGQAGIDRGVPFAIITGHSDAEYVSAAMELDVDAFMIKPVTVEVLKDRLQRILAERQTIHGVEYYRLIAVPDAMAPAPVRGGPVPAVPPAATGAPSKTAGAPRHPLGASAGPVTPATAAHHSIKCPLANVPVDAVLARDVVLANGVVLLRAGQALRPSLLTRLRDLSDLDTGVQHLWLRA